MISMVSLFLTLSLTLRMLVSIVNFEHISRLPRRENAEIRALYCKKRKASLTDCKLKCFSSRI